jgi:hypothetical protein
MRGTSRTPSWSGCHLRLGHFGGGVRSIWITQNGDALDARERQLEQLLIQRTVRGLALVKRRQAPGSLVALMMLSKQALAVGHCTTLQNGHTVFGLVFARTALGMAARAFF